MTDIDFNLKCARCGGELKGTPLDGPCPNCDASIGTTLDLTAVDPETMTVCQDVSCLGCGYNLRTLAIKSVCPECGRPVADSLHPRLLVFANPQWLRDQRGAALFALVAFLALAAGMVFGCLAPLFAELSLLVIPFFLLAVLTFVLAVVAAISTLLVGPFFLGRDEPSGFKPVSAARGLRGRWLLLLSGLLCAVIGVFSDTNSMLTLAWGGAACCAVGMASCTALNIRAISRHAPGPWLRRMATAWAAVLMAVLLVMLSLIAAAVVRSGSTGSVMWPRIGWPLLGLLGVAAYVLGLLTLAIYYAVLSDAMKRQGTRA